MCSQSSNHQGLATLTNHPTSCIVGEPESQSSSENYHPPSTQLSDMGMRYMTIQNDDNRFSSESVSSHSPVYSLEPSIQSAPQSSGLGISPYSNYYTPPSQNISGYSNGHGTGGSAYFAPSSLFPSISDNIKPPRLASLHTSPGLPQSRSSPTLSHISPPLSTRDLYPSHIPSTLRPPSDLLTRSPTLSGTLRGLPLSPASASASGFTSPISNMNDALVPPLFDTEIHYSLTTSDGQAVKPDIFGRIDKGFFMADNDWTCYRRNYFALNCSYTLTPSVPSGNIYLQLHGNGAVRVQAFSMSISAVVDGRDGKSIELVQHTPKRDKGPQEKPARVVLAPRSPSSHGTYDGIGGRTSIYDAQGFNTNPNKPATEATFERIQFKSATANNGKRRAAQQYYHLMVELFADIGNQNSDRYVKVASRMSAPMVVRGRSPGHYQNERRVSSNTTGGPGSSGGGAGGPYTSGVGFGRNSGDISMRGGTSSLHTGTSYNAGYDGRSHHYRSVMPPLNIPMDPAVSHNDDKHMDVNPCYMYYPGPIWDGAESRYHLPIPEYTLSKVKNEYGYVLPSLASGVHDGGGFSGRHCGRWNTIADTKGYFPSSLNQHDLSIT